MSTTSAVPSAQRTCTRCELEKPLDAYEVTTKDGKCRRAVCKPCYTQLKKERAKAVAASHKPEATPKPPACVKCGQGPDVVDFKWRSDTKQGGWRTECNACFNAKGYCDKYRERERQKDEAGYLARNAATHLDWVRRNPDKVDAQKRLIKTDPNRRWKALLTYVRQKHGDAWQQHVELGQHDMLCARMCEPCHYCGRAPAAEGDALNGLDRVDSSGIYSAKNTVACCSVCNAMKLTYSVAEFVTGVRRIVAYCCTRDWDLAALATLPPPPALGGDKARREARVKDKKCHLAEDEQLDMLMSECHLCGRSPAMGIDRVDASKGYHADNCKSCCTQCNYMKKDWMLDAFLGHVARIDAHTRLWVLEEPAYKMRQPLAVLDEAGNPLMVFPSAGTASRILGINGVAALLNMRETPYCCGHIWARVDNATYMAQCIGRTQALCLVRTLIAYR